MKILQIKRTSKQELDAHVLKKVSMKNRPGWLRVGVHFTQTKDEIKALVDEIKRQR